MKNPSIHRMLKKRLEPRLTMHQVLKVAITLEKEEQFQMPPVPAAVAPVGEDGVE